MSILMDSCCYSSMAVARVLAQATLFFSLMVRWLFLPWSSWCPSSSSSSSSSPSDDAYRSAEASARRTIAAREARDSLPVLTYGELAGEEEEGKAAAADTMCAVCLGEVRRWHCVRELRNCRHVFHMGCLDRWLDHDEHLTCPLCRAPLLSQPASLPCSAFGSAASEPSWAVEKLLYLFGDDLLFASSS